MRRDGVPAMKPHKKRTAGKAAKAGEAAAGGLRDVTLYVDGACRGNPGVGAYAGILLCDGHEETLSGAVERTTNNRMELTAAIEGLSKLKEKCRVRIFTDSQYLRNGMTEWIHNWLARGWRTAGKKGVLNRDLWEKLLEVAGRHDVEWHWVAGHSGDFLNERCDALANEAIDRFLDGR
jgi:ribonuclease HI